MLRPLTAIPLFLALAAPRCDECQPVPTSDPSPPTAYITIHYIEDLSGTSKRVTYNSNNTTPITIDAKATAPIVVEYYGIDPQGMRFIKLLYDVSGRTSTGAVIQPLLSPIEKRADCPRTLLKDQQSFDPTTGASWKYTVTTQADNWMNASVKSPQITILARR